MGKGDRHVTPEGLYDEATHAKFPVLLATIYNTLLQITEVGPLRHVADNGSKTYFDTNTSFDHHYFVEGQGGLLDIEGAEIQVGNSPTPPESYEVARVHVIVRLRRQN